MVGRPAYLLAPDLAELLLDVDLEEIPAEDLELPFAVTWIDFPPLLRHPTCGRPYRGAFLGFEPAPETIGIELAEGERYLRMTAIAGSSLNAPEDFSLTTGSMTVGGERSIAASIEAAEEAFPVEGVGLELDPSVVHFALTALLYIMGSNADVVDTVRAQKPAKASSARQGGTTTKQRVRKTYAVGYSLTIDRSVEPEDGGGRGGTGKPRARHFVRGCFVNQPYGKGRSLRKRIFRSPCIRGGGPADAESDDFETKPYVVR